MKQVLFTTGFLICAAFSGCRNSHTAHPIQFVDRDTLTSYATSHPLMLIIEIDEAGRLRLNKIETGTTSDMALLAEKLEAIFADRERSGIDEREVLIDPRIDPESEGFEELVRTLVAVKASPIRGIRNDR